jgi:hypothetical protein
MKTKFNMSISRLPVLVFLVVLTLVNFSSHQAYTAETSNLDPCALLAKEDVAKIIGEPRGAPKADTGLQKEKECNYTTTSGAWLKVSLYSSARWGMQKGIVSEMNPTDLPGLGEEAFAVKRGTTYEIYVRKGDSILEVSSTAGADVTKKFAERAAKELP